MDGLFRCVLYLAAIGILLFIVGRVLPKEKFQFSKFPFRSFAVEKEGSFYRKLGVQKWKDKVPDMSRVCPAWISSKKLPRSPSSNQMERMIQETCIAEWVHTLLCLLGFGCVWIWKGLGGWIVSILYALGNIPYIIIQRYNRPKLIKILRRVCVKVKTQKENVCDRSSHDEACFAAELQYRTRA